MAANVINNKYPVVAYIDTGVLNRENRYITNIEILSPDASAKHSFTVNGQVTSIASSGRAAALITGHEILFIDQNGQIIDIHCPERNKSISFAGEDTYYVMAGGVIERIKIKAASKILDIF